MNRIIYPAAFLALLLVTRLQAQEKSVLLDPKTRQLAKNELLPAQEPFIIEVPVARSTAVIRVRVLRGNAVADAQQTITWTRPVDFALDLAELPVDTRLHSNSKYSFEVKIYNYLSDSEKVSLKATIHGFLRSYLDAAFEANANRIDLNRKTSQMMTDLDAIMRHSLHYYENVRQIRFAGYSDIIRMKLEELQNARLNHAAYNVRGKWKDSTRTGTGIKSEYARELIDELQRMLFQETDNYLGLEFVKLYDSFVITGKYTERGETVLPIFIGYGGVYLGGNFGNLNYDSKAYAGVSLPLGSGGRNYFARTSLILGVFLNNLTDVNGKVYTGPIVGRPVFAGLGFRVLSFVHLQAGVVALSTDKLNLSDVKTSDIKLEPFIGLSAQFNLWLGFNKK